nr:hypothetical protein [Tanacetum cinerariifolium]
GDECRLVARWRQGGDDGDRVVFMVVGLWWRCVALVMVWRGVGCRDGGGWSVSVAVAVVVTLRVVAARGGEWCGGSNRSGWEVCFWGSP